MALIHHRYLDNLRYRSVKKKSNLWEHYSDCIKATIAERMTYPHYKIEAWTFFESQYPELFRKQRDILELALIQGKRHYELFHIRDQDFLYQMCHELSTLVLTSCLLFSACLEKNSSEFHSVYWCSKADLEDLKNLADYLESLQFTALASAIGVFIDTARAQIAPLFLSPDDQDDEASSCYATVFR